MMLSCGAPAWRPRVADRTTSQTKRYSRTRKPTLRASSASSTVTRVSPDGATEDELGAADRDAVAVVDPRALRHTAPVDLGPVGRPEVRAHPPGRGRPGGL